MHLRRLVALGVFLGVSPGTLAFAQTTGDGWRIRLQATTPGIADRAALTIGSSSAAAIGVDSLDDPHPPALPSRFLDLVTRHTQLDPGWEDQALPSMRYRAEYIPPLGASSRTIELSLEADRSGPVTVTWTLTSDLDLGSHFLTLRDLATSSTVDMRSASSYALSVTPGTRVLQIELLAGRVAPPVALDQTVSAAEDTSLPIVLEAVDANNRPLTYTTLTAPAHGTLVGTEPNLTYVPDANFHGGDSFTFLANNGVSDSNVATISVTVTPVNDAPVAAGQSLTTDEDTPLAAQLAGSDVDGDVLSFSIVTAPTHGVISLAGADFVCTPAAEFSGADSFVFIVSDGQVGSAPATVAITVIAVSDPPLAAFSVPGPARSAATTDNNLASYFEGASIVSVSSQSAGAAAANAIDENFATAWASASGQPANQSLTLELAQGATIDRIRLVNAYLLAGQATKRFEVRLSTTTTDPSAFTTVLSATALDDATVQDFPLSASTPARYLQFVALDNYGSSCCVGVRELEAINESLGGIRSYSASSASVSGYLGPNTRPEFMLDGNPNTWWSTPSGAVANQFAEVRLDGEPLVDRVRIQGWIGASPQVVKDFEVLLSSTTDDDAAFTTVLSATHLNNGQLQEFVFPGGARRARYARLLIRNNYGAASAIVLTFEVVTAATEGNLVSRNSTLAGFSSQASSVSAPTAALDANPLTTAWITAAGQVADQWLTLALPNGQSWIIDHVSLQPHPSFPLHAPRHFEVQLSSTTADASAFETIFTGTLRNNGNLQHFFFPGREAAFVRLLLRNNYGSTSMALQNIGVYSPEIGSAAARFLDRSRDVDSAIASHAWSFGDGDVSSERDPLHNYGAPALYDVTLSATDSTALSGARTQSYQVVAGPLAAFTVAPTPTAEGATLTFTDTSSDPAGIVLREWEFGNGQPSVTSVAPTTTHIYADNGAYQVRLRVTNSWGATTTIAQTVAIANAPPTVSAGADRRILLGQDWGVFPAVSDPAASDVATLHCVWNFGDGQNATIPNCGHPGTARIAHVYATPGVFTATLTVTDKDGATSSDSVVVNVYTPECVLSATGTYVEYPFCGNGYSIAELGTVPGLPNRYVGLAVKHDDSSKLLIGANATQSNGAIYQVGLARDAGHHVTGFTGAPTLYAPVPDIDGGLVYGPGNVLFTAGFPAQKLYQLEPGSASISKTTMLNTLPGGVESIALNFVPRDFPGECKLKFVKFFTGEWWSSEVVPDGSGTYNVTNVVETSPVFNGGPEHLLYVPAGSPIFADRSTVLVSEYTLGNIVAYNLDSNGDPIPSTRTIVVSGYPTPEGLTLDPVTGDLLITNLNAQTVKRISGFQPGPRNLSLSPATSSSDVGSAVTIEATVADLLGNPRQGIEVSFQVSGANAGTTGTCAPNPDCTADEDGIVRFTYAGSAVGIDSVAASFLSDSCSSVSAQPVAVVWTGNRPPVAVDASLTTNEDTSLPIVLTASDPDGDALTFASVAGPVHGSLTGQAPSLTYSPAANFHGQDSFTFTAGDGQASGGATVTIDVLPVNDPPVASAGDVSTLEDVAVPVSLVASDLDGDSIAYTIVASPSHGTLSGTAPALIYTPAADFNGQDAFTFRASDGVSSAEATVTIQVLPANDAAVPGNQTLSTAEDTPLAIVLTASDVDGDSLSFTIATGPTHGTLSGSAPSLTYTPAANFNGEDAFAFTVSDGQTASTGTITISITATNDAPVAAPVSASGAEDTTVAIQLAATDVEGDALTYVIVSPPAHGSLSGIAPDLVYTPEPNYHGANVLTYRANDGQADSNLATVSIGITPVNDSPAAAGQALTTTEDTPVAVTLLAADVDGDALAYVLGTPPAHGMLTGTAPALSYVPAANEHGPDSFTFTVTDGSAVSNVATVTIDVASVNDAPVAPTVSLQVAQGEPSPVNIAATDVDGDPLTYTLLSPPSHGALTGSAPDLVYTSVANYTGPDAFTFTASDGSLHSNQATVTLDVVGEINHAPVCTGAAANPPDLWPPNHKMKAIAVTNVTDEDGDPVAIQATAIWSDEAADAPGSGNKSPDAVLAPIQVRSERQGGGNGRVYIVEFSAADGRGASCTGSVRVCVPHDQGQGDNCIDDGVRHDATQN